MGKLVVFSVVPTQLPKLAFLVNARFPIEMKIESLKVIAYFPEDPEDKPQIEIDIPVEAVPKDWKQPEPSFPDALPSFNFNQFFLITPFLIKQEGYLRVRLIVNNKERVRVGALKISSKPAPSASPSSTSG